MGDDTRATEALNLADRVSERLDVFRKHFDERFDQLKATMDKSDERQNQQQKEINELRTTVAVLKDRWKWISAVAGLGGAGAATTAQQLLQGFGG